ncbi:MAG TPA: nucleotidyl transferase AbiEii/AbiGii toxin family protein [Roseomonas sp.]
MAFVRPQHRAVAAALRAVDADLFGACHCYFGGGTAIVLQRGEYRLSLDVDFLCADAEGYRMLRNRVFGAAGAEAFFGPEIGTIRPFRADQYGIRGFVSLGEQPIRFEIVREARITLDGALDLELGVPTLSVACQFAEKLLANADRGLDTSAAYRDAIDLGFLVLAVGFIPPDAIAKAEAAYGAVVARSLHAVLTALDLPDTVAKAADTLQMNRVAAEAAVMALRRAAAMAWPEAGFARRPG